MMLRPFEPREQYMTRPALPRALLPVLLICSALLPACSREADDWRAAQAADTVAAYEQFNREHPASSHATEATTRAEQLAEDEDWRKAQEQDSLQAYQQFLAQHPGSQWAQEARVRVETITLGNAAQHDPAAGTSLPPVAAGPHPATPAAASAAAPAPAATSPFGAQLGAFGSAAAAESQWQVIAGKQLVPLKGRSHRVAEGAGGGGRVFRLQVPARDEADARGLCAALAAAGQACVVVHP
jgi:cell division protein FtsN